MHWRKTIAHLHAVRDQNAKNSAALRAGHHGQTCRVKAKAGGIIWVQLQKRLGDMLAQALRQSGAGHGVPMVPHPPGVQPERMVLRNGILRQARHNRQHLRFAIAGMKPPLPKETPALFCGAIRPKERLHRGIVARLSRPIRDVEIATQRARNP